MERNVRQLCETLFDSQSFCLPFLSFPFLWTPSYRHKFDKENVHHHHHHHHQPVASFTGSSPKVQPVKPIPLTPKTAAFRALSPVTSPTLLQQNLSQMSLKSSSDRRASETAASLRVMTPTRMLDPALAVPNTTNTPHRHRVVKCRRRYTNKEGGSSCGTPDQSSASSSPGFIPLQDPLSPGTQYTSQWSAATPTSQQSSAYSLAAELSMDVTPTRPSPTMERSECMNPVAFTLWRGGHEDPEWLQTQDRVIAPAPRYPSRRGQPFPTAAAFSGSSPSPSSSSSTSSGRIPAPSSNLRDVYGANYSCEISRPIPMMARRQDDIYY